MHHASRGVWAFKKGSNSSAEIPAAMAITTKNPLQCQVSSTFASDDFPADVVRSRFLKLTGSHIQYVLACMKENTTRIRNIKKYLLAALYNASVTMGSYYSALVQHDLAEGG